LVLGDPVTSKAGREEALSTHSRWLAAAIVGFGLLAIFPASAGAARPSVRHFHSPYSGTSPCTGFDDIFSGVTNAVITDFTDRSGNTVREATRFSQIETDTNSVTGTTITVRSHFIRIDNQQGVDTEHGEIVMSNRPGRGVVIHDAGTLTTDDSGDIIKEAGKHEVTDTEFQVFCTALS
jgi:hypothetical protein